MFQVLCKLVVSGNTKNSPNPIGKIMHSLGWKSTLQRENISKSLIDVCTALCFQASIPVIYYCPKYSIGRTIVSQLISYFEHFNGADGACSNPLILASSVPFLSELGQKIGHFYLSYDGKISYSDLCRHSTPGILSLWRRSRPHCKPVTTVPVDALCWKKNSVDELISAWQSRDPLAWVGAVKRLNTVVVVEEVTVFGASKPNDAQHLVHWSLGNCDTNFLCRKSQ